MKNLIKKWLGITEYHRVNTELQKKMAEQAAAFIRDIEELKNQLKYWKILWNKFHSLEDYLGVIVRKDQIPDMSYGPPRETPMIEVFRYEVAPKKKKKS